MSNRTLIPQDLQDLIVGRARDYLRRQGRVFPELYYHTKTHPKSGEVSHLFRGKEALPKGIKTVRFIGLVDATGILTDLEEVGSRERKRIGSRGPVAGRIPVPQAEQKIVRRDRERKRVERTQNPKPPETKLS